MNTAEPQEELIRWVWSAITVGCAGVSLLVATLVNVVPPPGQQRAIASTRLVETSPAAVARQREQVIARRDDSQTTKLVEDAQMTERAALSSASALPPRSPKRTGRFVANTKSRRKRHKVPVLTFHDLSHSAVPGSLLTPVRNFEAMLRSLQSVGYQTVFASEVPALLSGRADFVRRGCKPVAITFDDGYRNNYELLFPLLKRFHMKATIFLIVGKVVDDRQFATKSVLTWDEVREMVASGLVEIGSHTYQSHRNLVQYVRTGRSHGERVRRWRAVYADLLKARTVLEAQTGKPVRSLAWPHGKENARLCRVAEMAGYDVVFNTQFGINVPGRTPMRRLRRISASTPWMSPQALQRRLWLAERGRGLDGRPLQFAKLNR